MSRAWRCVLVSLSVTLLGVMVLGIAVTSWARATADRHARERQLSAALGWAQNAPKVEEALRAWHQVTVMATMSQTVWAAQRFQQATAQAGVQVTSLQPAMPKPAPAASSKKSRRRPVPVDQPTLLKASVIGQPGQVAALLQNLSQWLPGLTVDQLDLIAQSRGLECRLELAVPPPPGGERSP